MLTFASRSLTALVLSVLVTALTPVRVLLSTMMIPTQAILVPQFRLVNALGLVGTFWAVIIPGAAATFGIFLARQFMLAIPTELIEAAKIDAEIEQLRKTQSSIVPRTDPIRRSVTEAYPKPLIYGDVRVTNGPGQDHLIKAEFAKRGMLYSKFID